MSEYLSILSQQEKTVSDPTFVSRIREKILQGVTRLQNASGEGLRPFHGAIVDLDHLLLSDLVKEAEEEIVISQASGGILELSQRLYISYETLLEEAFTKAISGDSGLDLENSNITQPYLLRYHNLAANEIKLAGITKDDKALFIGSGSFPITAIEYARQTGCRVDCVEILPDRVEISREIVEQLGLSRQIHIYSHSGQSFSPEGYSTILVGLLAQPKQDIIDNLEQGSSQDVKILARTTLGLRQFMYPTAQFSVDRFTIRDIHQAKRDQAVSTMLLT